LLAEDDDDDELFSSIKDPISRWIFDEESSSHLHQGLPLTDLFKKGHTTVPTI
jgi:hypothetical protein